MKTKIFFMKFQKIIFSMNKKFIIADIKNNLNIDYSNVEYIYLNSGRLNFSNSKRINKT